MKNIFVFATLLLLFGCVKEPKNTDPNQYLSKEAQENFKFSIVRYYDDLAPKATHETKFDTIFDSYYKKKSESSDLLFYYFDKEKNTAYFAITKIAPSIQLKKVATVGSVVYNDKNEIQTYQEKLRTWKMPVPELEQRTATLFAKYLNGEDLSEFYTKNAKGEFIIEFPDDVTHYDTDLRKWVTKK